MRPVEILNDVSRRHPGVWKMMDSMAADKGKGDLPDWAPWCYLPMAAAYAYVSGGGNNRITTIEESVEVSVIGALAAWRLSQGIYRFDPDLFDALWETPLNHELPIDLFFRLPEYCLYIETPGRTYLNQRMHGFFVHMEDDASDRHAELRLLLDLDNRLQPHQLHLDQAGILQSLERALQYSAKNVRELGMEFPVTKDIIEAGVAEITPLVSLVLYICSTNSEMVNKDGRMRPAKPRPKKVKKGVKYFPADAPVEWDVGLRTGAILRSAKEQVAESVESTTSEGQVRKSPIAHTRRAHWQTYWTGKGRTNPEVKWINMTVVNAEKNGIGPTIRKVEK